MILGLQVNINFFFFFIPHPLNYISFYLEGKGEGYKLTLNIVLDKQVIDRERERRVDRASTYERWD